MGRVPGVSGLRPLVLRLFEAGTFRRRDTRHHFLRHFGPDSVPPLLLQGVPHPRVKADEHDEDGDEEGAVENVVDLVYQRALGRFVFETDVASDPRYAGFGSADAEQADGGWEVDEETQHYGQAAGDL